MCGLGSVEPSQVKKKQSQMAEQLLNEGLVKEGCQISVGISGRRKADPISPLE